MATATVDFKLYVQAIKRCKNDNESVKSSATVFGVPRSNLRRYLVKINEQFGDDISDIKDDDLLECVRRCSRRVPSNQVFSMTQENALAEYLVKCVGLYYGLSINELRELAYQFAKKLDADYPTSWDEGKKAGWHWYYGYMARHPELSLRTPEQTSVNRVKAFCEANVKIFFKNLGDLLDEFHFPPARIYNMDESGFCTVPTKVGRIIAVRGMRRVGKLEAAERGTVITMALTIEASGNSLPPYFLFPRKKMQTCFLDNASPGAVGFANGSGWMAQPEFVQYMHHFITFARPSLESPVLLLLDNHSSHLSVEALDLAVQNGVHILSFPPHCSHRLQPLDVSVFGPVKAVYKSQCSAWQKNNANKVLEIRHIAGIVSKTLDLALNPSKIKAGFKSAGICPFNPDIFSEVDYIQAVEHNEEEIANEADLDENSQRRIVSLDAAVSNVQKTPATPEPSTSKSSPSILDSIGPLRGAPPRKPSNRGRKPMRSAILTSPPVLAELKDKATKRAVSQEAVKNKPTRGRRTAKRGATTKPIKPAATRANAKKTPSASPDEEEEDRDFCIICMKLLPIRLTTNNSIECNTCQRPVHLKCANMRTGYFTCKNCETDGDDE